MTAIRPEEGRYPEDAGSPEAGRCPEAGRLRAWLDRADAPGSPRPDLEPVPAGLADHLAACSGCRQAAQTLQANAEHAARTLDRLTERLPTPAQTEQALARLRRRLDAEGAVPALPVAGLPATRTNGRAEPGRAEPPAAPPVRTADDAAAAVPPPRSAALAAAISPTPEPAMTPTSAPHSRRLTMLRSLPISFQRWRLALGGLAAALAVTLVLLTPEGQAAAAGFLAQFRSQQLTIVTFNPEQARQTGLFRLEQLGTVRYNNQAQRPVEVANVQEAASRAGFPVLQPDPQTLPAGISRTARVRFNPAGESRLTFDREKTRQYFDRLNRKDLSLPDKLHGSTLVVAMPPMVTLEYAASDGKPALMVGQARDVQVGVEGNASLDEVRDFLLGLPDLPPDLARQLRAIQDWRSTLPIPVPVDKISWQNTTIAGAPAYILNDNTGLGSAVIWQRDGRIVGVAGPMKATDLRRVAESLK